MPLLDICTIGAAALDEDTGLPTIQAVVPLTEEEDDYEHFGNVDKFECLGVTALPWPANDDGHAEGIVARNVGNSEGVIIGSRDERCANVYGKLAPGDSALHTTDPDATAQVICKADTGQVIAITEDSGGKNITLVIDGTNDKIQITGFGQMFEMSKDQGISITDGTGTITIREGIICLSGAVVLGGPTPAEPVLAGPAGPVGKPADGVFVALKGA
jgi:hypothetical protein